MSRFRLAAFDLDGTLVDSAPDLASCLGSALAEQGLPRPSLAAATSWIGNGVEVLIERGLTAALGSPPPPELVRSTLATFDRCYQQRLFVESRLYPGVLDTLASLRAAGLVLGCVTNKREAYAIPLLDAAGVSPYLHFIHGGDTFNARKPDPTSLRRACEAASIEPAAAVMIGDSSNDRDAAQAAGSEFIFAAYGYVPSDDSGLRQGFGVIESFAELGALLCAE